MRKVSRLYFKNKRLILGSRENKKRANKRLKNNSS